MKTNNLKRIKMETLKKAVIQRQAGVWLSPERAAPFFRNGRGIALGSLMNNLRSGKLQDVSIRDAYGWLVFVPQVWIEAKHAKTEQAKVIPLYPNNTNTRKSA